MAKKYMSITSGASWEHFLNCAKAQFTATWSIKELQKRHDYTCNRRCPRWGSCSCKGCPVDQWVSEELAKVEAGRTKKEALDQLFALGTPEAQALYNRLFKQPHVTVIHYYHNEIVVNGNVTIN